ncbi:hypothetical protein ACCT11_36715, partial [Rhizobium johnstonii]
GDYLSMKSLEHFRHNQKAEIQIGGEIIEEDIPLAGDYQVANALVAAGHAMSTGVEEKIAMDALEKRAVLRMADEVET